MTKENVMYLRGYIYSEDNYCKVSSLKRVPKENMNIMWSYLRNKTY
jgi:hypothetical protein